MPLAGLAFDADGVLNQDDATATEVLSSGTQTLGIFGFLPGTGRIYLISPSDDVLQVVDVQDMSLTEVPIRALDDCSLPFLDAGGAGGMTNLGADALLYTDGARLYRLTPEGERTAMGFLERGSGGLAWVELPEADLAVSQRVLADPASVGVPLEYTVTVTNEGPGASGVTLRDPLPATASLVSAVPSQGRCEADECGGLRCSLGMLGAGEAADVSIELTPWSEGTLAHAVSVPGLNDPDPADNLSVEETLVRAGEPATLVSIDRVSDQLRTIDPTTGATLTSGSITLAGEAVLGGSGLATHPLTGELWALLLIAGQEGRELVKIDPGSLVATSVGDTGDLFDAMAFDDRGTLYGVTEDMAASPVALFTLDTTDATASFLQSLEEGFRRTSVDNALAFHPIDRLFYYATGYASNVGGPPQFASIDPGTAQVTPIPTCGDFLHSSRALTWLGGDVLFYTDQNRSFRILTTRGVLKNLGQMDHLSKGLAFIRNVPRSNLSLTQAADRDSVLLGRSAVLTMHVANEGSQDVSDATTSP